RTPPNIFCSEAPNRQVGGFSVFIPPFFSFAAARCSESVGAFTWVLDRRFDGVVATVASMALPRYLIV
ncbi:hypothetical protein O1W68_20725, partial [Rhodococcus sp. H36-A4]|uniref:hypothetical protein n=1 Tax=Rhodococcus sp. H36-A4 TaxID=3004353 RepID=UPI0022B034A2